MRKKVLLIASDFFGYYKLITDELYKQGWDVTYINDRPSVNPILKILIRRFRFLISWYLYFYYSKKIKNLGCYDHVLIVKGEGITPQVINQIRLKHCRGSIYLYLWDGIKNCPGALRNALVVDQVFTFDPEDARKYSYKMLPLFYVKSIHQNLSESNQADWDVSFIGSIHGDRLKVIENFKKNFENKDKFFIFVYFPSRLIFYFYKLFDPHFPFLKKDQLSLNSLQKEKAQQIFKGSKAVLDIHHKGQTGLTMRTLEVLSLGKKLITTNETIKIYPFYDKRYIYIIDRQDPRIESSFFDLPLDADYINLLKPYELSQWVKTLTEVKD